MNLVKPSALLEAALSTEKWAKHVLISTLVEPADSVCEFSCGAGVELERWLSSSIGIYHGVDLSQSAVDSALQRWDELSFQHRDKTVSFRQFDFLNASIEDEIPFNHVVTFHLGVAFNSESSARALLANASRLLKSGGYFFGIVADSSSIWYNAIKVSKDESASLSIPQIQRKYFAVDFFDEEFSEYGTRFQFR
jgi:SAM-dependent methyltransferase